MGNIIIFRHISIYVENHVLNENGIVLGNLNRVPFPFSLIKQFTEMKCQRPFPTL